MQSGTERSIQRKRGAVRDRGFSQGQRRAVGGYRIIVRDIEIQ